MKAKPIWIQTRSRTLNLVDPRLEEIDIHDIAFSLAGIYRFTGHTRISVAQHSVCVARMMQQLNPDTPHAVLCALLHDAHEAFTGDVSRPVRQLIRGFDELCHRLQQRIEQKYLGQFFNTLTYRSREVVLLDNISLRVEMACQFGGELTEPLPEDLIEIARTALAHRNCEQAEAEFLELFFHLQKERVLSKTPAPS